MDISAYLAKQNEKPLDNIVSDGGFCGIFRTIGCIGDSLSSGEFESLNDKGEKGWHDYYDYSWGQYIARMTGATVYNFSKGGMTAREYLSTFADQKGFWDKKYACQGYILALGVNDILNKKDTLGSISDIDLSDYNNNKDTFAGNYAKIIQKYREISPKSRIFLVTIPHHTTIGERYELVEKHAALICEIAEMFEFCYVIDLAKYGPVYDEEFRRNFFLASHMNAAGYLLSAKIISSYIDYIIRHNPEDFAQIGFVGTNFHNVGAKW